MEFGNPIVGGTDLIREAIKSSNFNDTESGVQGWQIARDGTATFYQLVVGSPNFTIDQSGNAVFSTLTADQILLGGTDLQSSLDLYPRGIIALTTLAGTSNAYNGTPILIGRIVIPNFDGTRMYALGASALRFDKQVDTTIDRISINCYIAWDTAATTASTNLFAIQYNQYGATSFDQNISFRHPFKDSTPGGTDLHVAYYLDSDTSSATGLRLQSTDSGRYYVEDIGPSVLYGSFDLGTGTPPIQTYTKTYSANGSASFQSGGTNRGVSSCFQGYYSGTNGNQYSMITFPYATIQADLSGATITKTELYLNNNHFYSNSGGTAIIGYHNQSSVSGSHSSSQITDNVDTESFTYGQAKWFTVTNTIGNAFKNNTAKGIALGPGPTNSQSYYGYFAGNGESGEPQLRITYTK